MFEWLIIHYQLCTYSEVWNPFKLSQNEKCIYLKEYLFTFSFKYFKIDFKKARWWVQQENSCTIGNNKKKRKFKSPLHLKLGPQNKPALSPDLNTWTYQVNKSEMYSVAAPFKALQLSNKILKINLKSNRELESVASTGVMWSWFFFPIMSLAVGFCTGDSAKRPC